MHFSVTHESVATLSTGTLIFALDESLELSASALQLDKASNGALQAALKNGDIQGKAGQSLLILQPAGIAAQRILLVGIGKEKQLSDKALRKVIAAITSQLKPLNAKQATLALDSIQAKEHNNANTARLIAQCFADNLYVFDQFKSEKSTPIELKNI